MRRLVASVSATLVVTGLAITSHTTVSAGESNESLTSEKQSADDALAHDMKLVAKAKGWTIEEAYADHRAAEAVGEAAVRLAEEMPDKFVGSVLSPEPGEAPSLYVKGPATKRVRGLVADSDVEIRIVDNQPYSFEELEERKHRVHRALTAQGFDMVSTGFTVTEAGQIRAGVTREPGLVHAQADILSSIPADLRDSVTLTVNDEPIVVDEHSFGGNWVRDDGSYECTSGWSVVDGSGTTGVTTAGHCTGINEIVEPGVGVWDLTHQQQHRGQWGDVEWKTSNHIEPAQFYATDSNIRDVNSVESRWAISEDESICQYGRSSNDRDCSLDVQQVSQECTNGGVWNDRLVLMDGDTGIGGDSGGGWSFGTTAYGGHKGNCADVPGREVFSVADLFDEAIGVSVRTQ